MNTVLKRQLRNLPEQPGVYQFFDIQEKLLYVGKAKSLRTRINSYFRHKADLSPSKQVMIEKIHHLSVTTVSNETEALLLEGNLIRQHQPPYNIILKDDKNWLYLAIDYHQPYPSVTLERRPIKAGVRYFGPYPQASAARSSFHLLKKLFGLKTCPNPPARPCFASSLGRCLGHDFGPGSRRRYNYALQQLERLLKGQTDKLLKEINGQMEQAADRRQFELAAKLRDRQQSLKRLTAKQSVVDLSRQSYDVLGLARESKAAAVSRLIIRRGILLDTERFLLDQVHDLNDGEIIQAFMEQYYPQATDRPKSAYLSLALKNKRLAGVKIIWAQRGKKNALAKLATTTALNHLTNSAVSWERRTERAQLGLKQLKNLLQLKTEPHRIEGYDISNIQGQAAVGAMVVLINGLPEPRAYRRFNIHGFNTPNDVAMLAEVLVRRLTKNSAWPKPDLVLLDGGRGQLSVVLKALTQQGISIPLATLAKRQEWLYLPGRAEPLQLPVNSPALLLLQELRNEAHRFGITAYRRRHRQTNIVSAWDKLPGVGPVLKRKLKASFGSLDNIQQTPLAKLAQIIGLRRAQAITEYLAKS
ncbi:MAG: excinuclease ABC subunit UvrC [Candidatus Kerfeldbacteria bacterium]|nr:excinuclease ABC subunit UvrC [Candidatus Kerfeldbacteria bacterium]